MSHTWAWADAKWWKVDCHCHAPASQDYGKGDRQSEYRDITPDNWLLDYMRAGIDCIAVADHNTGEWIDKLKEALNGLNKKAIRAFAKCVFFRE